MLGSFVIKRDSQPLLGRAGSIPWDNSVTKPRRNREFRWHAVVPFGDHSSLSILKSNEAAGVSSHVGLSSRGKRAGSGADLRYSQGHDPLDRPRSQERHAIEGFVGLADALRTRHARRPYDASRPRRLVGHLRQWCQDQQTRFEIRRHDQDRRHPHQGPSLGNRRRLDGRRRAQAPSRAS